MLRGALADRPRDVAIHQRDDAAMVARSWRHAAEDSDRVGGYQGRKAHDIVSLPVAPHPGDDGRRQNKGVKRIKEPIISR